MRKRPKDKIDAILAEYRKDVADMEKRALPEPTRGYVEILLSRIAVAGSELRKENARLQRIAIDLHRSRDKAFEEQDRLRKADGLLRRALPFVQEQLSVLREVENDWKGRESLPRVRKIKADIEECEAILEEAEGGGHADA